jgi:hypothetical protein
MWDLPHVWFRNIMSLTFRYIARGFLISPGFRNNRPHMCVSGGGCVGVCVCVRVGPKNINTPLILKCGRLFFLPWAVLRKI